ncbi:TPA: hypothetical protein ACH3X1_014085 [Trebouxia sp. C0004]
MVTGVELPKENIIGGHIASHSKRTDMECLLLIKNIYDVRNGMLWSQPIETAYEDSRICFAFDPADGPPYCLPLPQYQVRLVLCWPATASPATIPLCLMLTAW